MRAVLPALTDLDFCGRSEYLESLVAQLDAPRLDNVRTDLDQLDSLRLPQLSLFIAGTENLRFSHAQVEFNDQEVKIELDQFHRAHGELEPNRPHFFLSTSFEWSGTHVAHVAHVLGQIFALFTNVVHLFIFASEDHPSWQDDIDSSEWLAFLHLFTTVETLHIYGRLAGQVACALEYVPREMVTEVLPFLHLLLFEDTDGEVESTEQFASLRQLNGRPVTIIDLATD